MSPTLPPNRICPRCHQQLSLLTCPSCGLSTLPLTSPKRPPASNQERIARREAPSRSPEKEPLSNSRSQNLVDDDTTTGELEPLTQRLPPLPEHRSKLGFNRPAPSAQKQAATRSPQATAAAIPPPLPPEADPLPPEADPLPPEAEPLPPEADPLPPKTAPLPPPPLAAPAPRPATPVTSKRDNKRTPAAPPKARAPRKGPTGTAVLSADDAASVMELAAELRRRAQPSSGPDTTKLSFELTLSGHRGPKTAETQIWIDANRDGQMDAEEELNDLTRKGNTWRGDCHIPGTTSLDVGFRVTVRSSPGARYRLRVTANKPRRHIVYEQTDHLHRAQQSIIGWCDA